MDQWSPESIDRDELLQFFHCNKTDLSCMDNPQTFLCKLRDNALIPEDTYKRSMDQWSHESIDRDELLQFFHCHKTDLSCMDNPQTFLCKLRDNALIPEDTYKKVIRMRIRENQKRAIYEMLDQLETEQPNDIPKFWRCVFKETILNEYPSLRLLRNSLMDGSYREDLQLSGSVEDEELHNNKRKYLSKDTEGENSMKKSKQSNSVCDVNVREEQPGPSSQVTPGQWKNPKKVFSLKTGEKNDNGTCPKFKLPVTCGELKGTLNKSRLAKGEACILFQKQWFTPGEFEKLAGKKSCKNWKWSIRCNGTTLGKLIQEGHLEAAPYKGGAKKTKKSLFPSDAPNTVILVSDGEENENEEVANQENRDSSNNKASSTDDKDEEEETEQQPEANDDRSNMVFKVTCGAICGTLHKKRFASGTCGKSIRTERSWLSPMEFLKKVSYQTNVYWKKDIECEGKPLSDLIKEGILTIHSLCSCRLCNLDEEELKNQENDDECCVCKRDTDDEDGELVMCDFCPRSFHKECHLPYVDGDILKDDREWMCTFCVFRCYTYIGEKEMNEALSRQISGRMLQCQYLLLHLRCADEEQTFDSDPNLTLSDYSTVIQTPMWLSQVANKLQTREYETVGEFVSDVRLIFANCAKYNRDNAEFRAKGNQLKKLFDSKFKSVFNILC